MASQKEVVSLKESLQGLFSYSKEGPNKTDSECK